MKKIIFVFLLILLYSNISFPQWQQLSGINPNWVKSLASNGSNIFAGNFLLVDDDKLDTGLGVYVSSNNGVNWSITSLQIAPSCLHFRNSRLFACAGGLFYTDNNGLNWTSVSLPGLIQSAASNGTYVFCGGTSGIFASSNNGVNWSTISTSSSTALLVKDNYLYSANGYSLQITSNNGINWIQTSIDNKPVYSFATNGTDIFAGTNSGLYKSTNNGANWTNISPLYVWVNSILAFESNVIICDFFGNGIYKSTNLGVNWVQRNEGLSTGIAFQVLLNANGYIFAGSTNGLWRRSLQSVLDINQVSSSIPDKYYLSQNYPNPFNPVTRIDFDIPRRGGSSMGNIFVSLKVYDVLGREVKTLVNEEKVAGFYSVDFNGTDLTSGVYFYSLETQSYKDTKWMILIK